MADDPKLDPRQVERLLLDTRRGRRFTQDSPILPDVWLAYADRAVDRRDVLINPHWDFTAGQVAERLRVRLAADRETAPWAWWTQQRRGSSADRASIAYNGSAVAARLRLDELIRVVLPMTVWWDEHVWRDDVETAGAIAPVLDKPRVQSRLAREMVDPSLPPREDETDLAIPEQLVWMLRLAGVVIAHRLGDDGVVDRFLDVDGSPEPPDPGDTDEAWTSWTESLERRLDAAHGLVDLVSHLFDGVPQRPHPEGGLAPATGDDPKVYTVHRNRPASVAVAESALAVKADAARHLFSIDASGLTWAVLDSGIDARHPAFAVRDADGRTTPTEDGDAGFPYRSRVKSTYDFSLIRHVLSSDHDALEEQIERLAKLEDRRDLVPTARWRAWEAEREALERLQEWLGASFSRRARNAKHLREALLAGRAVDWELLGNLLEIHHEPGSYRPPEHNHGTHVAGILAGCWHRSAEDRATGRAARDVRADLVGVAPDLRLMDLRVLGADGTGDEFAVIAALQFLRHLNAHKDTVVVHGANLSLSIRHEVVNYACGATPVCEEAERLVASGVVVVAAAGNRGHAKIQTVDGPSEIYQPISITDPGNAEGVLTVGATHRSSPHTYGVSYFSSRGPTGDGRAKPDLVAPGEKITSAVPCTEDAGHRLTPDACQLDGTSMAAPHVSGVAALLLARHRELAGKPRRVKEILLATATDLGRERYFQGAGLVDALRALQSI